MHRLWQALWFLLPVLLAGLVHVCIIKSGCWAWLARRPLDCGLSFRGHRLLGDNKSLRGALVMISATAITSLALRLVAGGLSQRLAVSPWQIAQPALWGLLLGLGYIAGELPNSFIKRQLEIAPGGTPRGRWRALGWLCDQLDSMLGALLVLTVIWRPDLRFVMLVTALTLIVHPAVAALMVALGLKSRIG